MRKNDRKYRFIILVCIFMISCTNTRNAITEPNYADGNGTIIEIKNYEDANWIYRKHIQRLEVGDLSIAKNLVVYDKPGLENRNINILKYGDIINITQVVEIITTNNYSYWVKISTDNGVEGWIFGIENKVNDSYGIPYFENRWEILDIIQTGDRIWTVRKLVRDQVGLYWRNWDEINIYDNPGLENNIIYKIKRPENWDMGSGSGIILLDPMAATEEIEKIERISDYPDRWIKIIYKDRKSVV